MIGSINFAPQDRPLRGAPSLNDAEIDLKRMVDQVWRRLQNLESDLSAIKAAVDTNIPTKRIMSLISKVNGHTGAMPDDSGENTDHDTRYLAKASFKSTFLNSSGQRKINIVSGGELTIASGVITVTGSYHSIDTESDAASDDLDTISGGSDGDVLFAVAANDARTVVLKHGTGNIVTHNGSDYSLDTINKLALLFYTGANWLLIQP
jgi:hypothetical protein